LARERIIPGVPWAAIRQFGYVLVIQGRVFLIQFGDVLNPQAGENQPFPVLGEVGDIRDV